MRVLVTGGAGFIGSALVRALRARGEEVVVVDDLSGGSAANLPGGVELVEQDVARPETAELVERLAPEAVVHAAAQVSVVRSQADPDRDRQVNLGGTQHVLDGARAAGVRRFVFVSSGGAVYGESDGASETDPPHPASYYAVHKLAAEHYVAMSGLAYAVARPANVYGPGQRSDLEGGVVAIFAQHLAEGAPVTIYGDGEQTRDFVNVADVVDALVTMLDLPAGRSGGVWNVGTGEPVSVNELLERMEAVAGRSVERVYGAAREGEVRSSRLSIGLAERELGWRPRVSLDEGLRQVLAEASGDRARRAGEA
jgi:UDP-glucose 4-epimerase